MEKGDSTIRILEFVVLSQNHRGGTFTIQSKSSGLAVLTSPNVEPVKGESYRILKPAAEKFGDFYRYSVNKMFPKLQKIPGLMLTAAKQSKIQKLENLIKESTAVSAPVFDPDVTINAVMDGSKKPLVLKIVSKMRRNININKKPYGVCDVRDIAKNKMPLILEEDQLHLVLERGESYLVTGLYKQKSFLKMKTMEKVDGNFMADIPIGDQSSSTIFCINDDQVMSYFSCPVHSTKLNVDMNGYCLKCQKTYGSIYTECPVHNKPIDDYCKECDKEYKPTWVDNWVIPFVIESESKELLTVSLFKSSLTMDIDVKTAQTLLNKIVMDNSEVKVEYTANFKDKEKYSVDRIISAELY